MSVLLYFILVILLSERNNKEDIPMKANKRRQTYSSPAIRRYPYPGAAEPRYFAEKLLDALTAFATGVGAVTVFVFLMTM